MSFSENIKKYRLDKGYTQEQLSSLLGLSAQAISKWETSETYPDGALLVPLANALDVSLDALFGNNSASMKEISGEIKQLISSVPNENEFHTVRDLCWQMEKALFDCRMAIDERYDPEELKTQSRSSYILNNFGFTHVSNGRAPFFMVVPEYEGAFSDVIGDGEEIRKIFSALSSPETMRAVLFIHQNEANYVFEKDVLAEKCGIAGDQINSVIQNLIDTRLIYESEVEIDGKMTKLYSSEPNHLTIALFLIAHEMNYRGSFCYQSHYRNKTYL